MIMAGYAHPEALVSTQWVADHLNDPKVRIVETDEDPALYFQGHIPGAVEIGWHHHLQDPVTRDYIPVPRFEEILRTSGIDRDTTVVFYGDKSNWWACYALWTFQIFGHADCRIMDGGYTKWQAEGRPLVKELPKHTRTNYEARPIDETRIRAFRDDVLKHIEAQRPLLDVRSPAEFTGEALHMENYPQEGALRGGHIPGARNVPWATAVRPDGTFKSAEELRQIYLEKTGIKPSDEVIAYCRIGERSSHTWFVYKYLLGLENVRNYDGSWTEWGNLVRVPIVRGA
jgi:thiosulfate/3-mercaptopyruvate sulfurtransferase